MYIFNSTREIINTINQAKELIEEMFEKRKSLSFRYEYALNLVEENRLQMLIEREVLRQNGPYLELDERFQEFFELLLEANEEISTASIDENIQLLHQHIDYYLKEDNLSRKNSYLRSVKSLLRKIGKVTIRNVISLQRRIDNTFKTEPNYRIKIAKLENLDDKRADIKRLIDVMDELLMYKNASSSNSLRTRNWDTLCSNFDKRCSTPGIASFVRNQGIKIKSSNHQPSFYCFGISTTSICCSRKFYIR